MDKKNTKQAHAHIWEKVRAFHGEPVLYAFRFDNGKTKFGKSTNIEARTGDHLAHGITGCTGVTLVAVPRDKLDEAERAVLLSVASKYAPHASEVFASSPSEADDERLIREALGIATGTPAEPVPKADWPDIDLGRMHASVVDWRLRNPVATQSDRPADTRSSRERYLDSLPPFRSNHMPRTPFGSEPDES